MNSVKSNWTDKQNIAVTRDVKLAPYTTMGVGGTADYFCIPETRTQLRELINAATAAGLPHLVLGGGSNLVINDAGYRGLVLYLKPSFSGLRILNEAESQAVLNRIPAQTFTLGSHEPYVKTDIDWQRQRLVYAEAGVLTKGLSLFAAAQGLSGLEFACGIPGTVGGALFMNAGAYGSCMADVTLLTEYMDKEGTFAEAFAAEQNFSYRDSLYREKKHTVLAAFFLLNFDDKAAIQTRMDELNARRISTQPLDLPSSGSVFKRPEGFYAGKLIMDAGLKGKRIGGAEVSLKHAGFIVNVDQAQAQDIYDLVAYVQAEVKARFGVVLEPEIRVLDEYGKNLFH